MWPSTCLVHTISFLQCGPHHIYIYDIIYSSLAIGLTPKTWRKSADPACEESWRHSLSLRTWVSGFASLSLCVWIWVGVFDSESLFTGYDSKGGSGSCCVWVVWGRGTQSREDLHPLHPKIIFFESWQYMLILINRENYVLKHYHNQVYSTISNNRDLERPTLMCFFEEQTDFR